MENGWIKLHRKLFESLVFNNEKGLKIWIWCLLKANHDQNTFLLGRQRITILSGQFVTGSNVMKEELRMGVATIWYWLNILEKEKQVEIKRTNKYSVITIQNWKQYQQVENKRKADGKVIDKQMETNKNDKNVKNDKKDTETSSEDEKFSKQGAEIIKEFESINPASKKFYGRAVQRSACEFLIKTYGFERIISVIKNTLPKTNKLQFFPTIVTPLQLQDKWATLESAIQKYQSQKITNREKYPII